MKSIVISSSALIGNSGIYHFCSKSLIRKGMRNLLLKAFMLSWILAFAGLHAYAQNHEWATWFQPINGNANESWEIKDIVSDSLGNVYASGTFQSPVSNGMDTLIPHYPGSDDIYLTKYNIEGRAIWTKIIGGSWYDIPTSLFLNDTALFLAARIQGDMVRIDTVAYLNAEQLQVMSFDLDGNYSKTYFHSSSTSINNTIHRLSASDDALYLGSLSEITEFSIFPGVETQTNFLGTGTYYIKDIAVFPDNKKVVVGRFINSFSYQGNTISADTIGTGFPGFIFMLDDKDSLLWIHNFGKVMETTENPIKVEISSNGDVYLSASYEDVFQLNGENIVPYNLGTHSFIAKINQQGEFIWHKTFNPESARAHCSLHDLFVNEDFIYATGYFRGGINFEQKDTLKSSGTRNSFIAKLTFQGEAEWIDVTQSRIGNNSLETIYGDNNGNIFAAGMSYGAVDPVIGCTEYPSATGGLLLYLKDEVSDDLPVADFDYHTHDDIYYFRSELVNDTSFYWNFDDGRPLYTKAENPSYKFYTKGEFNVRLTVENACGATYKEKTISIVGLKEMIPSVSGTSNLYYGEIHGAGFSENATFTLLKDGILDIPIENPVFLSENLYKFSIEFLDAPIGDWDLIITNGTETDTLKNALNIESNIDPDIEVSVAGPSAILANRFFQYRIAIKNNSNLNLPGVPVAIIGKHYHEMEILNDFMDDSIMQVLNEELGTRFYTDTLENGEIIKIGLFAIPFLRANETFFINLAMKSTEVGESTIKILTGLSFLDINYLKISEEPADLTQKSAFSTAAPSCYGSQCADCLMSFTTYIPVVGCLTGIYSLGCSISNSAADGKVSKGEMVDLALGVGGTLLSCGGVGALGAAAKNSANAAVKFAASASFGAEQAIGFSGIESACGGGNCDLNDLFDFFFDGRASFDPNEKYGVKGISQENYIQPLRSLDYTITFENVDSATAPASEVYIYDTLDVINFDLSTLEWRSFGFGDSSFLIPFGNSNYITDIDLRPEKNIILRFEGSVDSLGLLRAKFTSMDTLTYNLTNNILDGFLPPNVSSPEGEGYIQFSIKSHADLAHGTRIENKATIIFDVNEPIYTGTWLNTIDTEEPVSSMLPLDEITEDTVIYLKWQGADMHSGIQSYDVYMSENGGEYKRKFTNLLTTEALLIGENEKEYSFYVKARDYAGNKEAKSALEETSTTIQLLNSLSSENRDLHLSVYPIPARNNLTVELSGDSGECKLKVMDSAGKIRFSESIQAEMGTTYFQLNTSHYASGTYFLMLSGETGRTEIVPFVLLPK